MEKLTKYRYYILLAILFIVGAMAVVLGKNLAIQGGVASICWGIAIFVIILITKQHQEQEITNFDMQAKEILEDIAEYGEQSEYFTYYNIDVINKIRAMLLKKHSKQIVSCTIFGVVLIIIAIICMV
ncbi:MAG: hypothetical protein IJ371_06055 [Clostridia bacterium]|nr:hypothetical protein [Clostridia bacterium]